jgi:hypothetical protein
MTDPTAKGYTAAPSIEEMKAAVLAVYPNATAAYINCGMTNSYWIVCDGTREISITYCGAMAGDAPAWADAYSKLPAKAAPDSIAEQDALYAVREQIESANPELQDGNTLCVCGHKFHHHVEGHGKCCICICMCLGALTVDPKAASESEDEAFERFARTKNYDLQHGAFRAYVDDVTFSAWEAWNARARMDAERGDPIPVEGVVLPELPEKAKFSFKERARLSDLEQFEAEHLALIVVMREQQFAEAIAQRDAAQGKLAEVLRQVDGACRAVDRDTGEDKTLEHVQQLVRYVAVSGEYPIPDTGLLEQKIVANLKRAEKAEAALATERARNSKV